MQINLFKSKTTSSVIIRLLLWFIMIVGGAIYAISKDWGTPLFDSLSFHIFTAIIGFMVTILAFRSASNGGKELTKGRVGDIPRLETNKLVTTGIYACMRHPMLFGLTLLPLGWALLLGSPTFIFFLAPLEMLFIVLMVTIFEEREVNGKFGEAYQAYREKVPMVSFKKECLILLFKRRK